MGENYTAYVPWEPEDVYKDGMDSWMFAFAVTAWNPPHYLCFIHLTCIADKYSGGGTLASIRLSTRPGPCSGPISSLPNSSREYWSLELHGMMDNAMQLSTAASGLLATSILLQLL